MKFSKLKHLCPIIEVPNAMHGHISSKKKTRRMLVLLRNELLKIPGTPLVDTPYRGKIYNGNYILGANTKIN
jgi:hypothetical protein